MAEQGQDQGAPDFAGLIFNQSKAKEDELTGFSDLSNPGEGKNKLILVCENCKCMVLKPGYSTLVNKELFMPFMKAKHTTGDEPAGETLTLFWLVKDKFDFENVGFSKPFRDHEKYLICADCEIGPIGWTDSSKEELYVSAERVKYTNS